MRLPREVNRRIGRALHDYAMLEEGDRVLVAFSGGLDSLVLSHVLHAWRQKAPIHYELHLAHVDMEPAGKASEDKARRLAEMIPPQLPLSIAPAAWRPEPLQHCSMQFAEDACFLCARSRRRQLFDQARLLGCNKIAFGHHQDDLIETFFLNLTCAGNISTMRPKQILFQGRLALIRPLAYLEKTAISQVAQMNELSPLASCCPLAEQTKRQDMQALAALIYARIPGAKKNIFAALANVRWPYLLNQRHCSNPGQPHQPLPPAL